MSVTSLSESEVTAADRSRQIPSPVLEFDRVTKRYGRTTVVDDLSFTVQPGRVTGFLGPNGSGKSTTIKILLGLASADKGRATIGGRFYREFSDPAGTVGVILEPNAFHPGRSGRNHLRILAEAAGIAPSRVDGMLDDVGLSGSAADRRVGAYSLGMRQRLSLAAALLGDPPVLVLDEPANGLDPQGIHTLRDLLRARAAGGDTVLVSSHILAEMELLADDLVVIDKGRLVASGPMADLQQIANVVRTPDPNTLQRALESSGGMVERADDETLIVRGLSLDEIGDQAFNHQVRVHELSPKVGSLEELFLSWTAGSRSNGEDNEKAKVLS